MQSENVRRLDNPREFFPRPRDKRFHRAVRNYLLVDNQVKLNANIRVFHLIRSLMTMEDVHNFRLLAVPLAVALGGYIVNCFVTGKILTLTCGFTRKEAMLATTPAGATDIALSSADMGVTNAGITLIHVFRAIIALTVFPQIINALLLILP